MILVDSSFLERYLDAANDYEKVTAFWNTYNPNPIDLLNSRQYWALRTRLFELLDSCKKLDIDAFNKIHKGHPYYFIGISSFLMDDYQTAVYFFDAAVTEDRNAGAEPKSSPTPSTKFLMLEGEIGGQTAKPLTAIAKAKVERALEYYQSNVSKTTDTPSLDLDKIRNNFIYYALTANEKPGLRTLATVFITYLIEWDFRKDHFEYGVKQGTSEPFFSHLFRGCLLFESLLKQKPGDSPKGTNLGNVLTEKEIRTSLKIGLIRMGTFTLSDVYRELNEITSPVAIDQVIQITYMTRNTLGHNLGWESHISHEQYQKLYFVIAAACLHVIACLWK